jgi:hypothetical protein
MKRFFNSLFNPKPGHRKADTISQSTQPKVGAEAIVKIPINSWEDLLK